MVQSARRDEWSWSCTGFAGGFQARFEALATGRAQAPAACEWGSALLFSESLQPAGRYRLHQRRVVTLRLICIGEGKRADSLVKGVALAPIATDGRALPGIGMGGGQGPAAEPGIAFELRRADFLGGS